MLLLAHTNLPGLLNYYAGGISVSRNLSLLAWMDSAANNNKQSSGGNSDGPWPWSGRRSQATTDEPKAKRVDAAVPSRKQVVRRCTVL